MLLWWRRQRAFCSFTPASSLRLAYQIPTVVSQPSSSSSAIALPPPMPLPLLPLLLAAPPAGVNCAAYLAAKAAGKGAAAPSEPTPTLRMRGLPFSATTDDISGTRPSDRTPD